MSKEKTAKKFQCFFCGKVFSKEKIDKHFNYGTDEFPVCINGEPLGEEKK